MLPHEWLRTREGTIKTDCLDHHADHFYPGRHDVAWDLAGAACEFELSPALRARLLGRFGELQPAQRDLAARVAFHEVAWLAFRLGYAALARETTAATAEEPRWSRVAARCRERLPAALARLVAEVRAA